MTRDSRTHLASWATSVAILLIAVLAGSGCTGADPTPPPSSADPTPDAGGPCQQDLDNDGYGPGCSLGLDCDDHDPTVTQQCFACQHNEPGCPCSTPSQIISCGVQTGGTSEAPSCTFGQQTCTDGTWGACDLSRGVPGMTTKGFGTPGLCTGNPCDPECRSFEDTPGGLQADGGVAVTDGGVTLNMDGATGSADVSVDGPPSDADIGALKDGGAWPDAAADAFIYHELLPGMTATDPVLTIDAKLPSADVYFLLDDTASMREESQALTTALANSSGLIETLHSAFGVQVYFGMGRFEEYQVTPYNTNDGSWGSLTAPYQHLLSLQPDKIPAKFTAGWISTDSFGNNGNNTYHGNYSFPESAVSALWSAAKPGDGLKRAEPNTWWVKSRASWPGAPITDNQFPTADKSPNPTQCPAGTWGYPCWRPLTTPIFLMFTDAPGHNGPGGWYAYHANSVAGIPGQQHMPAATQLDGGGTFATAVQLPLDATTNLPRTGAYYSTVPARASVSGVGAGIYTLTNGTGRTSLRDCTSGSGTVQVCSPVSTCTAAPTACSSPPMQDVGGQPESNCTARSTSCGSSYLGTCQSRPENVSSTTTPWNGHTVNGFDNPNGTVAVGANQCARITVTRSSGSGDPDLYTRKNGTVGSGAGSFDCRPYYSGGNAEQCILCFDSAGTVDWAVDDDGGWYWTYATVTVEILSGTVTSSSQSASPGNNDATGSVSNIKQGSTAVVIMDQTSNGGDPDLYVYKNSWGGSWDCTSTRNDDHTEYCVVTFDTPGPNTLNWQVHRAGSGTTTATVYVDVYDPGGTCPASTVLNSTTNTCCGCAVDAYYSSGQCCGYGSCGTKHVQTTDAAYCCDWGTCPAGQTAQNGRCVGQSCNQCASGYSCSGTTPNLQCCPTGCAGCSSGSTCQAGPPAQCCTAANQCQTVPAAGDGKYMGEAIYKFTVPTGSRYYYHFAIVSTDDNGHNSSNSPFLYLKRKADGDTGNNNVLDCNLNADTYGIDHDADRSEINSYLDAGDYYLVVDNSYYTNNPLSFAYVLYVGQWDDADPNNPNKPVAAPSYNQMITRLNAMGAKFIGIDTSGTRCGQANGASYSQYETRDFLDKIAIDTGSINGITGTTFNVSLRNDATDCSGGGTNGMRDAVAGAVTDLAQTLRQDITIRAVDAMPLPTATMRPPLPEGPAAFIKSVTATNSAAVQTRCGPPPAAPIGADTLPDYQMFLQCLPGTDVQFNVTFQIPSSIVQTSVDQFFRFDVVVLGNSTGELSRVPVIIKVPALQASTPGGEFIRDYDAQQACGAGPHPYWGRYTWWSTTPSDSHIDFFVRTADTVAGLTAATEVPLAVAHRTPPPMTEYGYALVDEILASNGLPRDRRYLRVRAQLSPSTDLTAAPSLTQWELEVTCVP